jgi:transcriptional regulator with PAS, ATPase and Fis domain
VWFVKELKNVKQFLQQVIGAFADVVDMELGVIDRNLEVIAGTGFFAQEIGVVYHKGCMTEKIILSPKERCIFVRHTKNSSDCGECLSFNDCDVLAFLMCPISYMGEKIGTFSVLALNEQQRQKLLNDYPKLQKFLDNLCNFIAITLNEKKMEMKVNSLANQVNAVINFVHEGIIAINADGLITNINYSARSMLDRNDDINNKHINEIFPDFNPQELMRDNNTESANPYIEREIQYIADAHVELLLYCNITLMHENNIVTGAVISFRRKEELKKLVNRIIGEEKKYSFEAIKGTSPEMIEIKKTMKRVANTDSTLMIRGETGTGKSLFARAAHEKSYRRNKPFVTVNCAAIPATLLESELFGYEEGAFTGAKKGGKLGKFEIAHEGTLFLDEIGDMPLSSQVKLLQVIETRRIERVGGVKSRAIDVRIIAATNQDLESLIEQGQFRKDLFYRVNVIPFFILPLRERREDINLLIHHFLDLYNTLLNKNIKCFAERAKESLNNYSWPGNVRELANAIEYAVNIETGNEISMESLPGKIINYRNDDELGQIYSLDYLEKNIIIKALRKYGSSTQGKERAAAALGISRATLYRKIKEVNSRIS